MVSWRTESETSILRPMKRITLSAIALTIIASSSLFAGPPDFKSAPPPPPPCEYGTGWYVGLDGGANVYQHYDGSRERTFLNGDVVEANLDHNVGGYGGIKVGYVFGKETIRFALEEDMFYNGISTDFHLKLNGNEVAHSNNPINSGAFMTNFIVKFAFGKVQPYAGAGVGAYYAASAGSDITINQGNRTFSTGGGASSGSLAWDVVAGADYYWTCKWSTFVEYHYLDYVALDVGNGNHQIGQHLVGAGIRFHF
jgi:opacity protein-like surface antigen